MIRRLILWLPFGLFVAFLVVVAAGLYAPSQPTIPSALIGQPVPEFTLAPGVAGRPGLASADLRGGRPHLVNIFASWCLPCRVEAPQLAELQRRGIPIVGIAVRDRPEDIARFLAAYGDPFRAVGADLDRHVQLELGSAGVPETFVVDGRGIIRHQHIGAITDSDMAVIVAAYEAARSSSRHAPPCAPADAGAQFGRFAGLLLSQEHKWLAVLAALFGLLTAAPAVADSSLPPAEYANTQLPDPRQERRARALMETIRCLVCQGQSIADSDAEMAGDMRALIRRRIQAGEAPESIRAWLVARYGNWVTYDPPFEPVTWPLWGAPVLLILAGLWLARGRFRRRRR